MNEHDALIRAILESPADDTARLVYADWLQEHGQDARAGFIRTLIAHPIADRGCLRPVKVNQHSARQCGKCVVCKAMEALRTHLIEWTPDFDHCVVIYNHLWSRGKYHQDSPSLLFSRGFVSAIALGDNALTPDIIGAINTCPIERVTFTGYRVEIDPPGPDHGWQLYYYLPEEEGSYFAMSGALFTRDEMVTRLIQDVQDLETEFA